jgi:tRNA-splicing ligase RtcB
MKQVIATEKVPIKIWTDYVEEGALEQAKHLANLPFVFKHVALMPDVHQGYGMPIGGVVATRKVIIPNAVGMDIGCGMMAIKLNLTEVDKETLKQIVEDIRRVIPVGFKHQAEPQDERFMPHDDIDYNSVVAQEYQNARTQLGTLGSGNHFIEIQKDTDGYIWIMLHSGSRNLGAQIARHYDKIAKQLNERWFSSVPAEWDLAFLPADSEEGQQYIKEMNYAVDFAKANRQLMMQRILDVIAANITEEVVPDDPINISHNFAALEHHFGQNVWVHRKGATKASKDTVGIIPGSQGSKSYIVKGLGNPQSFMSCSHGAGRRMSRNEARKVLTIDEEQKKIESIGAINYITEEIQLDEAPSAYKDIEDVISNESDLIETLVELRPLATIKGN